MSVSNGQPADANTFNNAFMSRTADTSTTGVVALNNVSDPNSGAVLSNAQRAINETFDAVGITGIGDATSNTFSSTVVITNGDTYKVAIGKLDAQVGANITDISLRALDSEVVKLTGAQSIAGDKTFSDNVIITGNLTVNGTTTTLNTATLDVEDVNITINKNGNDASSEGAGITVERTGTDGSLIYEDALTSKFKLGALGSEVEIADVSSSQTFTGKDYDGGTASNTSRLTLPKGDTASLNALTRKEGTLVYDTTTSEVKFDDGSVLSVISGGGGGATEFADDVFRVIDNGDNTKKIAFEASAITTSTTRTITMPDSDVDLGDVGNTTFADDVFRVQDNGDATKQLAFEVSAITTATTRTITVPDSDLDLSTGASGSFANANLSNLDSPTAVNQSLIPGASALDLGDSDDNWNQGYLTTVNSGVRANSVTQLQSVNIVTEFNGTDEYAAVTPDSALGSGISDKMTVVTWVWSSTTASQRQIVGHWMASGSQKKWLFLTGTTTDSDHVRFLVSSDGSSDDKDFLAETVVTFGDSTWHMIAMTHDGALSAASQTTPYIDAVDLSGSVTKASDASVATMHNSTADIQLALLPGGNYFAGRIGFTAVYDTVLTQQQINELYNDGNPIDPRGLSSSEGLVSFWGMGNGDTTPTILDRAGNNNLTTTNMDASDFVTDTLTNIGVAVTTFDQASTATADILIKTGETSGTRGGIIVRDGSEGTVGHVLTAQDTTGTVAFQALPESASTQLDNLSSVSINSSLLFDTDSTYNIGSNSVRAANLYVDTVQTADLANCTATSSEFTIGLAGVRRFQPDAANVQDIGRDGREFRDLYIERVRVQNSGTEVGSLEGTTTTSATVSVGMSLHNSSTAASATNRDIGIYTADQSDSTRSGNVRVDTGDNSSTGDTGSFIVRIGSSTSGTNGRCEYQTTNIRNQFDASNIEDIAYRTGSTSGAVTADLYTFDPATANDAFIYRVLVGGRYSAGAGANASDAWGHEILAVLTDNSGTMAIVGSTTITTIAEGVALVTKPDVVISGTSGVVRVTGLANVDIDWFCKVEQLGIF